MSLDKTERKILETLSTRVALRGRRRAARAPPRCRSLPMQLAAQLAVEPRREAPRPLAHGYLGPGSTQTVKNPQTPKEQLANSLPLFVRI